MQREIYFTLSQSYAKREPKVQPLTFFFMQPENELATLFFICLFSTWIVNSVLVFAYATIKNELKKLRKENKVFEDETKKVFEIHLCFLKGLDKKIKELEIINLNR